MRAVAGTALLVMAATLPASGQEMTRYPAVLAGHAALPAMTMIAPPADAPKGFSVAGKFTAANRRRETRLGAVPGITFTAEPSVPRSSGVGLPVEGQVVQGFSAIEPIGDGTYFVLSDNGFGNRVNSSDALLMVHHMAPDWASGRFERRETVFLADPDRKVPFAIVNENTEQRYLTGADFDPESLRLVGDDLWIGDEFGPYLLRLDRRGKVLDLVEAQVGDRLLRSPDHYTVGTPAVPGPVAFEVRRSRGFEPMGKSPDGRFLYPALEGPLVDPKSGAAETLEGRPAIRILEFSTAEKRYTGRFWFYPLTEPDNVVGDLAMVDAGSAILIERDDSTEGSKDAACAGAARPDCFNKPARFKRLVKVVFGEAGQAVRKAGYIDLLEIADPDRKARLGSAAPGTFAMPHLGPEGLALVDGDHLVVVNDNNFPYSSGRTIGRPDDDEIALLRVPELIRAR